MRFAMFIGNNEIKRLPDGLFHGVPEHRRRATAPVSDDA